MNKSSVFAQLPYPVKSTLVFTAFHCVGLLMFHFTIGALITMPQWVAISTLYHYVVYGDPHVHGDWYLLGTILYASVGLGFGLVLGRYLPPRLHTRGLLVSLIVLEILIYAPLVVLQVSGIWDPMAGW